MIEFGQRQRAAGNAAAAQPRLKAKISDAITTDRGIDQGYCIARDSTAESCCDVAANCAVLYYYAIAVNPATVRADVIIEALIGFRGGRPGRVLTGVVSG
jgi:hypothetical protein